MNFEFNDDQLELQRMARDILQRECPPSVPRRVHEEDVHEESATPDLWATLTELDWPALALPERFGGVGMSWVELAIVIEELGRAVAPSPFLGTVTQFASVIAELGTEAQCERWLTAIADGSLTATVALDEGTRTWRVSDVAATAMRDGDELVLSGTKSAVVDAVTADELAVAVVLDGEIRVVVVPGSMVEAEPDLGVDATTPEGTIVLDGVRIGQDRLLGDGDAAVGLERAVQEATVAISVSTVGACQKIFELTTAYVKEREQFGVPIGSFQAVKHKLADMYRDVERARALVYFAALCLAEDEPRRTIATAMAKASAGECQVRCVQDGLQLFGGIGYTWENDLHLYLRRAKAGELLFGSAGQHRQDVARLALAGALDPSSA